MYSNYTDNDTIQKGRKKVFASKQKLELLLPNGKKDGELEVGDLVYVVQKIKRAKKDTIRFRVIKFAESPKEKTIYSSELKYFSPYYEEQANAEGEVADVPKKSNYKVPVITTLAGGVLGYLMAQRFNKNKMIFGIGGVALGLAVGIFLIKNKKSNGQ